MRFLVAILLGVVVINAAESSRLRSKVRGLRKRRVGVTECTVGDLNDNFVPYVYESVGDYSRCWTGMERCDSDWALYSVLKGVTADQNEEDAVTRYWTMCNSYESSAHTCFSPFLKWLGKNDDDTWKRSRALCWMWDHTYGDHFDNFMKQMNQLDATDREKIVEGLGPYYYTGGIMIAKLRRFLNGKAEPARVMGRALTLLSEWEKLGDLGLDKAIEGYGQAAESAANAIVRIFSATCENGPGTDGFPTCCLMVNMDVSTTCHDFFERYKEQKTSCGI